MKGPTLKGTAAFALVSALAITIASRSASVSLAQDDPAASAPPPTANDVTPKPRRRASTRKAPSQPEKSAEAPAKSEPAGVSPVAKTGTEGAVFSAQLEKAGRAACGTQIESLAKSTMDGVVQYNTMSEWSQDSGEKRTVSLAIGQRYADGSTVPFGISQIFSVPNQRGSCDGFVVQIVPSQLPCDKLETSLESHGKRLGDLAGITIVADVNARSMLVPTGYGKCVIVATRSAYAK